MGRITTDFYILPLDPTLEELTEEDNRRPLSEEEKREQTKR